MLAGVLGLSELVCVATEHWVGEFKLDILCTDGDEQVIIENQLEKTNHSHLGQLIAYAAGVGARKVIWIAEKFRPEHAAALQFLNDNTTEDLAFFAVEVELWRIGDSPLAPKFEAVVKPDNWTKTSRELVRSAAAMTPVKLLQQSFWASLVEYLGDKAPGIRPQQPRTQHWLTVSLGRTGIGLIVTSNTKDERLGVELYLRDEKAKQHFDNLVAMKDEIESKLGFPLDWQRQDGIRSSRISAWYPQVALENKELWPAYLEGITQKLIRMATVLRPIVRDLP